MSELEEKNEAKCNEGEGGAASAESNLCQRRKLEDAVNTGTPQEAFKSEPDDANSIGSSNGSSFTSCGNHLAAECDSQLMFNMEPHRLILDAIAQPPEIKVVGCNDSNQAPDTTMNRARARSVIHRKQSGGPAQYQPERGDLRALEEARKRRQTLKDAGGTGDEPRERLVRAGSFNGSIMLNIRRSAWTLSEFERTFVKSPSSTELYTGLESPELVNRKHRGSFAGVTEASCDKLASKSLNMASSSTEWRPTKVCPATELEQSQSAATSPRLGPQSAQCAHTHNHYLSPSQNNAEHPRRYSTMSFSSCLSDSSSYFEDFTPGFGKRDNKPLTRARRGRQDNHWKEESKCASCFSRCNKSLINYIPVLSWLPSYQWRHWFIDDFLAGLAVSTINLSMCLSSAVVAETNSGTAFRASVINCFFYSILCTSRHTSFGALTIFSQMVVVSVKQALSDELILSRLNLGPSSKWSSTEYERLHLSIIVMYAFLIGLFQLLGGLCKLGNTISSFIPEALGSSMMAATAFTMCVGQLANMCGTSNKILWSIEKNTTALWADLKNPPVDITDLFAGLFRWVKQIALLIKYNQQINMVCVAISVVSLALLFLNQYVIQRKLEKCMNRKIFIPFEVILMVGASLLSGYLNLAEHYNVTTYGPLKIDLTVPQMPNLKLIRELWFESLMSAVIAYSMVNLITKKYSNKHNYEVDYNQELVACGVGNLIGSFFDSLPATGAFARTMVKAEAGNHTQLASVVNCITLLVVAKLIGQYVALLPVCVTSAAMFFSFARMIPGISQAFTYWRVCKVDFSIWMFSFMAVLCTDLVNGFFYGFMFSIITMLYRAQSRRCYMLGSICSSDVYVPLVKYPVAQEIPGIKIFQFCGPVHYVNADIFERMLRNKTRINVSRIRAQLTTNQQQQQQPSPIESPKSTHNSTTTNNIPQLPSHIILDFSMISFVDTAGILVIKKIIEDYESIGITILVASLASHVAVMVKKDASLWGPYKERFYVTLADAVHCAIRANRKFQIEANKMETTDSSP